VQIEVDINRQPCYIAAKYQYFQDKSMEASEQARTSMKAVESA